MAIYDNSAYNTNALSTNTNKWLNRFAIPIVVKRNMFLYALKNQETGAYGVPGSRIKTQSRINGNALNVQLLGSITAFTGLADANQTDAITLSNREQFGASTFSWAHFYDVSPLVSSESVLIRGDSAQIDSILDAKLKAIAFGWEKTCGDGINGTNNAARTTWGGWRWGCSDGVSTGESSYATYGTIDRSLSENADYRGNVRYLSSGELTLDDVMALITDIQADGGQPTFGVVGQTGFLKLERELRGTTQLMNADWDAFPGMKLGFRGVTIGFESRCGDTELGMFDPEALTLFEEDTHHWGKVVEGYGIYKSVPRIFHADKWGQFIVTTPSHTGKITNILS